MRVFISGGTGYMGQAIIPRLLAKGHQVTALVRPGSEGRVPSGCLCLTAQPLDASTFIDQLDGADAFVHLLGVPHPAPSKARQFREIDLVALKASVTAAARNAIRNFVYVSVAQPAPVMKAYQAVRAECEQTITAAGLNANILRPWYVLGPGHRWPYALVPLYRLGELFPSTRAGALRLGLVTLNQMAGALVWAVENPSNGIRVLDVAAIRGSAEFAQARQAAI